MTGSASSVQVLDTVIVDYCSWRGAPAQALRDAASADPGFSLGNSMAASMLMLGGNPGINSQVTEAISAAEVTAQAATVRERMHLEAARALSAGKMHKATDIWESILLENPRDALAGRFAQEAYLYLGESQKIRDSVARTLPFWSSSDAFYGRILGQYAFGLEEAGDLRRAEDMARGAIALDPEDGWAVHALAHVLEDECRHEEGIDFLKGAQPGWSRSHNLAVHNGWHLALYLIENSRFDEALAGYDKFVQPLVAQNDLLAMIDGTAMLWRVELAGASVGDRWAQLSRAWMARVDDHVLAFNDLHLAISVARGGSAGDLARVRDSLDRFEREGVGDNHDITVSIGRRLIDGALAFAEGNYAVAVDRLLPVRYRVIRIGASHAQRDILAQTVLVAAERASLTDLWRSLLNERYALRPTPLTEAYMQRLSNALTASHATGVPAAAVRV
ncbi:tetratricopeptide repeat protein [Mycobacterium sp. 141]|uniref:tetratricopeptide repeat protein n=1 Tax=Mycobacterium sp. 141 TaxID=1120797 RepID=UPI0012DE361C|nr:tetratricopeptide repeat protein [Mycobacterium sp. 141]